MKKLKQLPIIKLMGNFDLENRRVLILDDNKLNVELLAEALKPLRLDITTFCDPDKAIETLLKTQFDLFLLDIMIPEISGFDVAKVIRSSDLNKNSPIIFISALSDDESKINCYNLGSVAFIEKPFNIQILQTQIVNILKLKTLQEAVLNSQSRFFAMATHDLKTPIYAEIRALEILLKNNDNFFEQELISELLNSSKYMKNLVENILLKYKSENNKINLQFAPYSIETVIKTSIEEIKYILKDKKQKIRFKNKAQTDICTLDYVEIKRTINNLLSNAQQYSPQNSVIRVELTETKNDFIVTITNKTLFDPEPETETKTVNAGLGLYICKKIIELHNGNLKFEKLRGHKSRFSFNLPKHQALPK